MQSRIEPTRATLRAIAVFKLAKVLGLLVVAAASFDLIQSAQLGKLAGWIAWLPIQHGHLFLLKILDALVHLGPHRFAAIGAVACVYASLFAIEGWGLWRGKRWAEYLTVVATSSLIPFEMWEIARHASVVKLAALCVNVAIVAYLVWLLRRTR